MTDTPWPNGRPSDFSRRLDIFAVAVAYYRRQQRRRLEQAARQDRASGTHR